MHNILQQVEGLELAQSLEFSGATEQARAMGVKGSCRSTSEEVSAPPLQSKATYSFWG